MTARPVFRITHWMHPRHTVTTLCAGKHMKIPTANWLQMEVDRWKSKNFREAWVETSAEGLIALFCWREELPCPADEMEE